MRYLGISIGLFSVASVTSVVAWFASTPGLSINQFSYASAPSKEIAINDTTFIKQMKASLNEGVSEPPVEGQVRPIIVSYDGSYGVNEEYLRRICNETTQR